MNDNKSTVMNNAAVQQLRKVPGFDPMKLLRKTISVKTGHPVWKLDLRYKRLWFRLACPNGRMLLKPLRISDHLAIIEAQVYFSKDDPVPAASFTSEQRRENVPGGEFLRAAQEDALNMALENAGFGIQFCDVSRDYGGELFGSEVPIQTEVEEAAVEETKALIAEETAAETAPTMDKIVLDNVTVTGRLLVWGGGTKAVYCNAGTNMPAVVVARVDDAVKVIYDRDSTLAVIDTIKVRITERAKAFKETEVVFYDVSGLREAQKQLNAIVADNQIDITAPAHLYALVGATDVKAEFTNNSKNDTYKIEIRRNKDDSLIADVFELAAGKSVSTLTLLEKTEFGNVACTIIVTAFRDGKQIGTLNTELTLHAAYLWPQEVQ